MKTIISSRASTILFNWLKTNHICGTVIMPANICETIPAVYLKCGFKIVWLDISSNYNVSNEELISLIKKGNFVVHYNYTYAYETGKEGDLFKFLRKINPNTIIVEDRCLCVPKKTSNIEADLVLYSTGPKKIVDLSYGGYAFTSDKYGYENHVNHFSAKDLEQFEIHVKDSHKEIKPVDMGTILSDWLEPFDNRYDEEEYFSLIKNKLNKVLKHKKKINAIYAPLASQLGDGYNLWRFNLLVENKDTIIDSIFRNNMFCSSHYMSLGNGYFFEGETPVANYLYNHVVNLFNDFYITEKQAEQIVSILRNLLNMETNNTI